MSMIHIISIYFSFKIDSICVMKCEYLMPAR